jgi:8-oxo-dGTP diphosphatase
MPASPQGNTSSRYSLIPRTLIFATRPGKVLLIKGDTNKTLWAGLLNGIGGHIERGEDVLSAARREFMEETGLRLENAWICGVVLIDTGESPGIGIYVLRGEAGPGELRASAEGELVWAPINQALYEQPLVEDLPVLLPRVLSQQRGSAPFSALYQYNHQGRLQMHFS